MVTTRYGGGGGDGGDGDGDDGGGLALIARSGFARPPPCPARRRPSAERPHSELAGAAPHKRRAGIQNICDFLSPRRFHRAYGYKGGNCAHKASSLLIHVHLRGKILTNAQRLRWLEISALMAKINGEN
jgi:hypothetical protein